VLAVKELTPEYFEDWKSRHHDATTSLVNREEKLDAIYEEIERDMKLIGATAIEDKLQDGVSSCIANLVQADIKVWVLTGDKQGKEKRTSHFFGVSSTSTSGTRAGLYLIKFLSTFRNCNQYWLLLPTPDG